MTSFRWIRALATERQAARGRAPRPSPPARATLRLSLAGIVGTVVAITVAALCVRLGIWQLHRLAERKTANAAVAARISAPPLRLTRPSSDTVGLLFRRVALRGEYDAAHSMVLAGRSFEGAPGVDLVTPLRVGSGAVLVDRGWLPSPDAATVDLSPYDTTGTVEVTGIVLPLGGRGDGKDFAGPPDAAGFRRVWYAADEAMLRQLPYATPAVYVRATPEGEAPLRPRLAPSELPARRPPPELSNGPHLNYAIQWFSFAAIALVGWAVVVRRGGVHRRADRE